jgi:hypothetical protein
MEYDLNCFLYDRQPQLFFKLNMTYKILKMKKDLNYSEKEDDINFVKM